MRKTVISKKSRVFNRINFPLKGRSYRGVIDFFQGVKRDPKSKDTLSTFSRNFTEKKTAI